jgi:hypothetical protein
MTTARDIIAGAYQRLGLLPLGADLDPDRAAAGLSMYNDMLSAWAADGIIPGPAEASPQFAECGSPAPAPSAAVYNLNDDFPLLPQFVEGAKAILAVELASASGIEAQASTQARAKKAYEALLARYVTAPQAGQDLALTWLPSLRRYGFR